MGTTDNLILPDCDIVITPGSHVRLGRFSKIVWDVHYGWYTWGGNRPVCGWYLTHLGGDVKPLQKSDLDDIYTIELDGTDHHILTAVLL